MDDKKGKISIIAISIVLGIILAIQFKTVRDTVGSDILPTQRAQQLSVDLKKAEEEKDLALKALDEAEIKVKQYEEDEANKSAYAENIYKDLEKYRMLSGYVDLEGPGILLEISEPSIDKIYDMDQSIVDDLDLILQTISVLNAADAEAISINDQRYTSYTEIERAGEHIEVNGVSIGAPIIIKAIGDPETLESALSLKRGIVWTLEYYDYNVNVKKEKKLNIPKYRKLVELNYAKPIEMEDK